MEQDKRSQTNRSQQKVRSSIPLLDSSEDSRQKTGEELDLRALLRAARDVIGMEADQLQADYAKNLRALEGYFREQIKSIEVMDLPVEHLLVDALILSLCKKQPEPFVSHEVAMSVRAGGISVMRPGNRAVLYPFRKDIATLLKHNELQPGTERDITFSYSRHILDFIMQDIESRGEHLLSEPTLTTPWTTTSVADIGHGRSLKNIQPVLERWISGPWPRDIPFVLAFLPTHAAAIVPSQNSVVVLDYDKKLAPFIADHARVIRANLEEIHGGRKVVNSSVQRGVFASVAATAAQNAINSAHEDKLSEAEYLARQIQQRLNVSVIPRTLIDNPKQVTVGMSSDDVRSIGLALAVGRDTITPRVRSVSRTPIHHDAPDLTDRTLLQILARRQAASMFTDAESIPAFLGTDWRFDNVDLLSIKYDYLRYALVKVAGGAGDLVTRLSQTESRVVRDALRADYPDLDQKIRATQTFGRDDGQMETRIMKLCRTAFVAATVEFQKAIIEKRVPKLPARTFEALQVIYGPFPGGGRVLGAAQPVMPALSNGNSEK